MFFCASATKSLLGVSTITMWMISRFYSLCKSWSHDVGTRLLVAAMSLARPPH